jgi:hypothetical protein
MNICIFFLQCVQDAEEYRWRLTLRGRVMFPTGSKIPIETDGTLEVSLQDVTMADSQDYCTIYWQSQSISYGVRIEILSGSDCARP